MSNPAVMRVKEGRVECIARDVLSVVIYKSKKNKDNMKFLLTYRATGESKPVYTTMKSEGIQILNTDDCYTLTSEYEIDVYLSCTDGTGSATSWGEIIVYSNLPDLGQILSNSRHGIRATTFADDYAAQGKAFQIQRRITLTTQQTLYLVLDTTALVASGKCLIILPLIMSTNAGSVFVDTYPIESYTGGSEIKFARLNSTIENYAESVFKTGITPTGTPGDELRQYIVGALSTNQNAGGGAIQPDLPKRFPAGSIITAKLVNQETDTVYLDFGLVVYEV